MTYFEKIVDAITGEESMRPFTAEETKVIDAAAEAARAESAAAEAEATAKAAARTALLDRLGITADEAALLLG